MTQTKRPAPPQDRPSQNLTSAVHSTAYRAEDGYPAPDAEDRADAEVIAAVRDRGFSIAVQCRRCRQWCVSPKSVAVHMGPVCRAKCRERGEARTPVIGLDGKAYRRKAKPREMAPAAAMGEEEAMRAAARAAELSAWGKACDGLLAALSFAASSRPPENTDRYPAVAVFIERYAALGEHITKWAEATEAVAE